MKFYKKRLFCLLAVGFFHLSFTCWLFFPIEQSTKSTFSFDGNGRTLPAQSHTAAPETEPATPTIDASCLSWCRRGAATHPPYFLTAVLLVRIYATDLARLTTRELRQWLYYLRYAGVEHVYVYDAYHEKAESQRNTLEHWIAERFVTYVNWSHMAKPYSITRTQATAYQDCMDRWGNLTTWQTNIDMDEYPFSPTDAKPGFMLRFIENFTQDKPYLSQMSMQNFLFLGKPLNDTNHPFLIDRLRRRTKTVANKLVKPIYQPKFVQRAGVHHHILGRDDRTEAEIPAHLLRMNHYWGARLQNWGEDTEEILSKTEADYSVGNIVASLQKCDVCLPSKDFVYSIVELA